MSAIRLGSGVTVPEDELEVAFTRSGGPGGQHVNTSSTKVELRFDVDATRHLTEAQKRRVHAALGNRITKDGVLVLTSSEHRSQTRNRDAVIARFTTLVGDALRPPRRRQRTRPTRASKERRLEAKRRRSDKKALRRNPDV
ncbi:MAG: alternative ribosome rescue aminoacyl-tRNA hydrolase ArfB [Egibacteraceae bacterium]